MTTDFLDRVTALVLTYNEAPNIERTLSKLGELRRIIVIDSGSNDGTREIVATHSNAEAIVRPFDTHSKQWTFGLAQVGSESVWVLALDADHMLSDELVAEIAELSLGEDVSGYRIHFRYCVFGKAIRSGAYPPLVALYRKDRAKYIQDGHTQRVVVEGRIGELKSPIYHDDRKSLARWLDAQRSYARIEAENLEHADRMRLKWQDRVRLMIGVAPPLMFFYVYLIRGGFLDGRHGLYYALQRAYAELLLSIELLDGRLRRVAGD